MKPALAEGGERTHTVQTLSLGVVLLAGETRKHDVVVVVRGFTHMLVMVVMRDEGENQHAGSGSVSRGKPTFPRWR